MKPKTKPQPAQPPKQAVAAAFARQRQATGAPKGIMAAAVRRGRK